MFKYRLEATVFIASASVMIFELVGSRLLGPYFGTSLTVWTILIGVILGSMSCGYYLGGRFADINASFIQLSFLIFGAALSIFYVVLINDAILSALQRAIPSAELGTFLSSIVLFVPASILLGMISPYAIKMKVVGENKIGATVGNISAISTGGSILGTFIAGLYLIPHFGTTVVLLSVGVCLLLTTLLLSMTVLTRYSNLVLILAGILLVNVYVFQLQNEKVNKIDVDTAYNRIWIRTYEDEKGRRVRTMGINNENHTSIFLDSSELVNEYVKFYHLASVFSPDFTTALMFGGAGYSFPRSYLETYPLATLDVVEIDPGVTKLAREYFNLTENPRLKIFHQDGRVFLNKNTYKYDVIFGDAFSSRYSLPYQLTTQEAVRKMYDSLTEKGIALVNVISAIEGEKGMFLRAELRTYQSVFPYVEIYPVIAPEDGKLVQNIMIVAAKFPIVHMTSQDKVMQGFLAHRWANAINEADLPVITDEYAPVDYYIAKALR